MKQKFEDLPMLRCFESGGCFFEKQGLTTAKNYENEPCPDQEWRADFNECISQSTEKLAAEVERLENRKCVHDGRGILKQRRKPSANDSVSYGLATFFLAHLLVGLIRFVQRID